MAHAPDIALAVLELVGALDAIASVADRECFEEGDGYDEIADLASAVRCKIRDFKINGKG